ncbi:MAG TPA: hypothetical protein VN737_15985, partial [Bryobacteraceae bacterium]|nr:hypothetical protein [Bryobacteraceae bacterium]
DLVSYALLNNSPYEDTLGRGQKIGKEEIAGMVKALELYLNEDHDALAKEWSRRLNVVSDAIKRVPGVTTSFFEPDIANHVPTMKIAWDPKRVGITPRDASKALMDSNPSIILGGSHDGLEVTAFMLKPGEDKIIAERLAAILKDHVAS